MYMTTATSLLPPTFVSSEPWNERRIRALAMYCSDGRWGDAFDEFCHERLHIPRYDRFAVPGGPASLAEDSAEVWEQLGLLVKAHELQRIVLISHFGCAAYMHKLGGDAHACLPRQVEDLEWAAELIRTRFPQVAVESFVAMRDGGRISFHRVI
jgi:hypothetical protein